MFKKEHPLIVAVVTASIVILLSLFWFDRFKTEVNGVINARMVELQNQTKVESDNQYLKGYEDGYHTAYKQAVIDLYYHEPQYVIQPLAGKTVLWKREATWEEQDDVPPKKNKLTNER